MNKKILSLDCVKAQRFFEKSSVGRPKVAQKEGRDYSPFGLELTNKQYTNGESYRYGFNGKEKDNDISDGSLDFGARVFDSKIGRFFSIDRFKDKYPYYSSYLFAGNTPIRAVDIGGDSLYILFHVQGYDKKSENNLFKAAALTRKYDIENSESFDISRDRVEVIGIKNLSEIGNKINNFILKHDGKYGNVVESGIWSHSGLDGPIGSEPIPSDANPLYEHRDSDMNSKQMNLEGWGSIDFHWSNNGKGCRFGVYGCNSGNESRGSAFSTNISGKANLGNVEVSGQTTSSYPSLYTNVRGITLQQFSGTFLPITRTETAQLGVDGPITSYSVNKTYLVGGDNGEGGWAVTTGTNANPMTISKNGKKIKSNTYQEGDKW